MVDRGFGVGIEKDYGEEIDKSNFPLDWFTEADDVDFKLNDEPLTRSGSSRMNKRARAGVIKPTGSTTNDADLQKFAWFMLGYLGNYKYTKTGTKHTHEFWGGENKELPSFRIKAVYDKLVKYINGALIDQLGFEVSDEAMTISTDWIYKTEKAGIIGRDDETFTKPELLTNEELFIAFYDVVVKLNNKRLCGEANTTSLSFDGNNNHDVDSTIGLGSRAPQRRALAQKRENGLSLNTTLIEAILDDILAAEYGEVGALEPTKCKIMQVPLEIEIAHCENSDLSMYMLFPKCTLRVEYNFSGADAVEVTMSLDSLGSDTAEMLDGSEILTDMYVKIVNNQPELGPIEDDTDDGEDSP